VLWLEKAAELEEPRQPPLPELAQNLGIAYEHVGRYEDALKQYQKVEGFDPADTTATEGIKRMKEKLGIKDETPGEKKDETVPGQEPGPVQPGGG
jgi:tetratricopeptide (TPR) repeat protein